MLRRLFISLIILSALTSEGIVNLPANIYNMYIVNSGIQSGMSGEEVLPSGQSALSMESGISFLGSSSGELFVLAPGSVEKLKCYSAVPEYDSETKQAYTGFSVDPVLSSAVLPDSDIIYNRSDSSPPYFNL